MHESGAETDWQDRCYAYECIFAITGIQGHPDIGYIPYYSETYTLLQQDILAWKEWYDANKYTMTIYKADSLIHIRGMSIGLEDIIFWPPSCDSIVISDKIEHRLDYANKYN
jgi:hypothetical protein